LAGLQHRLDPLGGDGPNCPGWPKILEQQRIQILGASLMVVEGQLQSEQGVIHIIAHKVRDYTAWLGRLAVSSRDFR
jgi:error-prone DNA polymerase